MQLRIEQVDPADEEALTTFHDVYVTCGRHDSVGFAASPREEIANVLRRPTEDFAFAAFLAWAGDEAVGQGWYVGHRRANLDQAFATPRVLPAARRRGVGSAVLEHLTAHARADGRSLLTSSPRWAVRHGPTGDGAASVEFARRHGYRLVLVEARRRLALPVAGDLLDELAGRVDPAYEIRAFAGPVPDDLVQGWAELEASLPTEAPTGDLEFEEPPPSVDAIRDAERLLAESGQTKFNAAALAPDGTVVGYTDIAVRSDEEPATQWGTLVRRDHRGRGLGHGLKAAVVRLLQEERPRVASTVTSNALDNAAMVAVNDRLGYEVVEYIGDVQRRIA